MIPSRPLCSIVFSYWKHQALHADRNKNGLLVNAIQLRIRILLRKYIHGACQYRTLSSGPVLIYFMVDKDFFQK